MTLQIGEVKYEDFLNENIPERRFKLVYPNREFFFLTEEERNLLLDQVNGGQNLVQIGEHTFSKNFTLLYPIRPRTEHKEYIFKDGGAIEK